MPQAKWPRSNSVSIVLVQVQAIFLLATASDCTATQKINKASLCGWPVYSGEMFTDFVPSESSASPVQMHRSDRWNAGTEPFSRPLDGASLSARRTASAAAQTPTDTGRAAAGLPFPALATQPCRRLLDPERPALVSVSLAWPPKRTRQRPFPVPIRESSSEPV